MKSLTITLLTIAPLTIAPFAPGCGSTPSPATTTPSSGSADATAVLPDVPFDELDADQRVAFMKQRVVPTMGPLFQAHDAKEFGEFGCKTCHGPGAERGEFDMPNDALPKLDFADMSKWEPKDLEWMNKVVKPTMAKLLGRPEFSPETPDGFGCLQCHTAAGS